MKSFGFWSPTREKYSNSCCKRTATSESLSGASQKKGLRLVAFIRGYCTGVSIDPILCTEILFYVGILFKPWKHYYLCMGALGDISYEFLKGFGESKAASGLLGKTRLVILF